MIPPDELISEEEFRSIIRLLGDVCSHAGTHSERKRFLMNEIVRLVDADAWVWGQFIQLKVGEFPSYVLHLHGGFDEEQLGRYIKVQALPEMAALTAPMARLIQEKRSHVTRYREQFDVELQYQGSVTQRAWREVGIEPGILSCRPIDANTLSTVAIYRRVGKPGFTERDSRVAHILLSELPWVHLEGWPTDSEGRVPELSPRACTVLNALVQGRGRDLIAQDLGLSRNTVDGYVKDIYRHFSVRSQAELIVRLRGGDGGDRLG